MPDLVNAPEPGDASKVTESASEIPERYQGKSAAELVAMHQEAEKKIGEQGSELGNLRPIAERYLSTPVPVAQDAQINEDEFWDNPTAAVTKIVQQLVQPMQSVANENAQQALTNKLNAEHPNWNDTIKDPEFQQWVGRSKVRVQLWEGANLNDYDSANELLSNWSAIAKSKGAVASETKKAVQKDRVLRDAKTERGAPKIDGRKILNRGDLQKLRMENPDRYNELLPDIKRAYQEGRVR